MLECIISREPINGLSYSRGYIIGIKGLDFGDLDLNE